MKNPEELANFLEKKHGIAMWRYSWVVPKAVSVTKNKEYHYEYPKYSSADIINKSNGRGYKSQPKLVPNAKLSISIYLKYVDNLYVVDFDDKAKCNNDNEFWKMCRDLASVQIDTTGGSHFYFYIDGVPNFTCSTKLQSNDEYGDVDLVGRKEPGMFNVVENNEHNIVENVDGGYADDVKSILWDDIKSYLNEDRMTSKKMPKKSGSTENFMDGAISTTESLDNDKFEQYLSRLNKVERYHYEDWFRIGCIFNNNWTDKDTGFMRFWQWTRDDPNYDVEHAQRTLDYCQSKWNTMGKTKNPATWKTLRGMANQDDPSINQYQELWDMGGDNAVVNFMNEFIVFNRNTCEIIYLDAEDTTDMAKYSIKASAGAALIFSKWKIEVGAKKPVNPYNIWIDSSIRRDVCRIVFDPRPNCPKNVFNVWTGFDIDELDVGDLSLGEANVLAAPLLNHLFNIWCKGNREYYNFLISWFARVIQHPWEKVGILLVAQSAEGAGKGIVYDFLRTIVGKNLYAQINSIDSVVGNFNPILEGKVFINCDEAHWGGCKKDHNKMKQLITDLEVIINDKHIKPYQIRNTTAFMFASNDERPTSAQEGDRRHFGLKLSDKWAGRQKTPEHTKYFCDISGSKSHDTNLKVAAAFAKVLFTWDLSNFNVKNPPYTDFISDQFERNWSPIQKWFHSILKDGVFTIAEKWKVSKYDANNPQQYDERELEWGWITGDNGVYEKRDKYEKTEFPLELVLKLKSLNKNTKNSLYCKWIEWCESCGYDWGDTDYTKLPIPLSMILMYRSNFPHPAPFPKDGLKSSIDLDENKFHKLMYRPDKGGMAFIPRIPLEEQPVEEDYWFDSHIGFDYCREATSPGFYDRIDWDEVNGGVIAYPRIDEDICDMDLDGNFLVGDEESLAEYIDKWGDGVNAGNFRDDLIVKNDWIDNRENKIFYHNHINSIKIHLYYTDWFWDKFTQATGLGYGSNMHDSGSFWKEIKTLMGGDEGVYKKHRFQDRKGARRLCIEVPTISDLRKQFEKWTGRPVDWGDLTVIKEVDIHADE